MYIDFPEVTLDTKGIQDVVLPKMVTIRQLYSKTHITDISGSIRDKMTTKIQNKDQFKDKSICLTVGSRGISLLDIMVMAMCDILKSWGAKPFIVPSMGSHGGATAEGQLAILLSLQ